MQKQGGRNIWPLIYWSARLPFSQLGEYQANKNTCLKHKHIKRRVCKNTYRCIHTQTGVTINLHFSAVKFFSTLLLSEEIVMEGSTAFPKSIFSFTSNYNYRQDNTGNTIFIIYILYVLIHMNIKYIQMTYRAGKILKVLISLRNKIKLNS